MTTRKNQAHRKAERRERANERTAARALRTPQEQLEIVLARAGKYIDCREATRLLVQIIEAAT